MGALEFEVIPRAATGQSHALECVGEARADALLRSLESVDEEHANSFVGLDLLGVQASPLEEPFCNGAEGVTVLVAQAVDLLYGPLDP